jgi:hypothetical protein
VRTAGSDGEEVYVTTPFARYYVEESIAPEAERAYRGSAQVSNAYITVRVLDGRAVIDGLYIDDEPLEQYLHTHAFPQDD